MTLFQRLIGMLILIALLLSPGLVLAQDENVTVVGSGVAAPLFEALVSASGQTPALTTEVTGTRAGLERLCAGTADIALTTRAISDTELAACESAGVTFHEMLLGDYGVALIGNPADAVGVCLSAQTLNQALAPSAQNTIVNWRALGETYPDLALTLIVPPNESPAYALLDTLVEGDALRSDVTVEGDADAVIETVASTPGALGVVPYAQAAAASDSVRIFDISPATGACVTPSPATLDNGQYPLSQRLFAYVSAAAAANEAGVLESLGFLGAPEAADVVTGAGFVAPTEEARATNQAITTDLLTGRQHSIVRTEFTIPPTLVGALTLGGDTAAFGLAEDATTAFSGLYQGVRPTLEFDGRVAGARRFCNGELDMIAASAPLSEEQLANCTANNVVPVTVPLGRQSVVLVANAANEYAACLTTAQLSTIWSAASTDTVTAWNQVDASLPETPLTLIAPLGTNEANDLLMQTITGVSTPVRDDVALNGDPLYRAASVAVVDGALTFMTWNDWARVQDNNQTNIQPVAVDAGSGCVAPSEATVSDGSYPLTRPIDLIISQTSLRRAEVQSFVWFLFEDDQYPRFSSFGLQGVAFDTLPNIREGLQTEFDAAGAAVTPAAEGTPSADATPGAEGTPAAEVTPAAEGTPAESTPEATPAS